MESITSAHLLRIFVGESDKVQGQLLYEAIVIAAKKQKLAGATVLRGILAYGANSIIHRAQLLEISSDLPIVIEIVDETEKIRHFVEKVKELFDRAGSGGLITLEKVEVIVYKASEGE